MRLRFKPDVRARRCLGHEILRGGSAGPQSIGEEGWLGWPFRHRTWIPKILRFSPDKIGPPPNFSQISPDVGLASKNRPKIEIHSKVSPSGLWCECSPTPLGPNPPGQWCAMHPQSWWFSPDKIGLKEQNFTGRQWGIGANVQGSCQLLNIRLFPFLLSHFRHTYLNGSKSGGCHNAMTG